MGDAVTVQKRASASQVAVSWLKSLPDLAGVDVAATLAPVANWTGTVFVALTASLGGVPDPYMVTRQPVVQLDIWANAANSNRPAWNQASLISEAIRDACYGSLQTGVLTIPGEYMPIHLHSVTPMSEPRRLTADVAAIARYSMDVQFVFTPVNLAIA